MSVRNRTAQCNRLHGLLLKYGIESPRSIKAMRRLLPDFLEDAENEVAEGRRVARSERHRSGMDAEIRGVARKRESGRLAI